MIQVRNDERPSNRSIPLDREPSLLHDLLRHGAAWNVRERKAKQRRSVAVDELCERGFVAGPQRSNQLGVVSRQPEWSRAAFHMRK